MTVINKPWGYYEDLYRSTGVVLKRLVIDPGEETSLQYHDKRVEMWYVQEGLGTLVRKDRKRLLSPGDTVIIEKGSQHQIMNQSTETLVLIETQCGECEEEDIVRVSDKYER